MMHSLVMFLVWYAFFLDITKDQPLNHVCLVLLPPNLIRKWAFSYFFDTGCLDTGYISRSIYQLSSIIL